MSRHRIPLGGRSNDIRSRRSREEAINCYLETNSDGEFSRLARAPCFSEYVEVGNGGKIRGMLAVGNSLYVVCGSEFYKITQNPFGFATVALKGSVTGSAGNIYMDAIGTDTPQVMAITNGTGFIYDAALDTFTQITDVNFTPDIGVTSFNQRFWLNKPDSNEFFASEVLDGLTYPALFFASADNNPDTLKNITSINTEVLLFGTTSIERWYDIGVSEGFNLRRIQGGTINRGILAAESLAQFEGIVFWLADDMTVRVISGGAMDKISDLAFETAVVGYNFPSQAFGFFVDYPYYKCYCLTFPSNNVTWCYDIARKLWHKRDSVGVDSWRIGCSTVFGGKTLLGDRFNNKIYAMDDSVYTEDGVETPMTWVTASTNINEAPMVYSYLELVADMGVGTIGDVNALGIKEPLPLAPILRCARSLDGGFTYKWLPDRQLGRVGDRGNKVIWRESVRVARTNDLVHKFESNGNFPVNVYSAFIEGEGGIV